MNADENIFFAANITHHQRGVMLAVDEGAVEMQFEIAICGRKQDLLLF